MEKKRKKEEKRENRRVKNTEGRRGLRGWGYEEKGPFYQRGNRCYRIQIQRNGKRKYTRKKRGGGKTEKEEKNHE